jgi:hypothetical protein
MQTQPSVRFSNIAVRGLNLLRFSRIGLLAACSLNRPRSFVGHSLTFRSRGTRRARRAPELRDMEPFAKRFPCTISEARHWR